MTKVKIIVGFLILIQTFSCFSNERAPKGGSEPTVTPPTAEKIIVGAERTDLYFPKIRGKRLGMVVNQTSMIGTTHVVDSLLAAGMHVVKVFAPEHGFRGDEDAGAKIVDSKDTKTGLPIVSLYGKNKKPNKTMLEDLDMVIFDIQDVGARFYTYISTMHYVMEACAENGIDFMVLDRPNPIGHYVDGYVLDPKYKTFVGMDKIPIAHGMTVGELARMINGEGWLKNGVKVNLEVIPCDGYDHNRFYELPVKPSPNLPNMRSIYLYPSLCLLEGTRYSVGRGTHRQFQLYGHPDYPDKSFSFTPKSMHGAKYPKFENKTCYGVDLTKLPVEALLKEKRLNLSYLLDAYRKSPDKEHFFLVKHFDRLAGTDKLRKMVIAGNTEEEIRASWKTALDAFKRLREKYLLY